MTIYRIEVCFFFHFFCIYFLLFWCLSGRPSICFMNWIFIWKMNIQYIANTWRTTIMICFYFLFFSVWLLFAFYSLLLVLRFLFRLYFLVCLVSYTVVVQNLSICCHFCCKPDTTTTQKKKKKVRKSAAFYYCCRFLAS